MLDPFKSMAKRVSKHTPGQDPVLGCQVKSKDAAQTVASPHGLRIVGISREAAARAPPLNRVRHRQREVRPRIADRPYVDPNIATPRQLQELKDGLARRLPSELPEEASKACDICQKDYSATHVAPTEEEEIAIVLSCGHSFGEFCMFEWFDTCRRHKNKVTCPMCRKQLIEAPRHMYSMMHDFPRHGQAFADLVARETLLTRQQLLVGGIRGNMGDMVDMDV
ncbi:zf-RING-2 multi-domain protein [Pyrenophora tritici-repentis]|nr:zf-RING-2 multi-domain protein [Pyrenophora tritici-repentis]KAI1530860.1 zf-RING-2 multi-domain protein [Pyrenophora tritici-repentis]KAI1557936.1 zf-RING-2 multi-domain protein [Pyrenophora tritici-repentis]KAI1565516.1 zf-RING-2 multi-domain protein [Pyrenophora tritici-repentis]KAI1595931.1 zf-RING-2 multi-domain protein [Pyrenophora tritici-repentis]